MYNFNTNTKYKLFTCYSEDTIRKSYFVAYKLLEMKKNGTDSRMVKQEVKEYKKNLETTHGVATLKTIIGLLDELPICEKRENMVVCKNFPLGLNNYRKNTKDSPILEKTKKQITDLGKEKNILILSSSIDDTEIKELQNHIKEYRAELKY